MTLLQGSGRGAAGSQVGDIDALLGAGLDSLDITADERGLAEKRYLGFAEVLEEHWEGTRGSNRTFPQGSFRLGTVTRRVDTRTDIDIDLVALRDVDKTSISQAELKKLVGEAAHDFAGRNAFGYPLLSEDDRCWTLSWPGMHMDVLPALPDPDAGRGLLIADRGLRYWQFSDPEGYADWFTARARDEYRMTKALLARELEIEDVPAWRVKTTLQRSVQALKRHRDIYFLQRPNDRPSSIVITTLAALAYRGGGPLLEVLQGITGRLADFIDYEDGLWVLRNPVQDAENFAEYWNTHPSMPRYFREWAAAAAQDFRALAETRGTDQVTKRLEHAFGSRVASSATHHLVQQMTAGRAAGGVSLVAGAGGLAIANGSTAAAQPRMARPNTFHGGSAR